MKSEDFIETLEQYGLRVFTTGDAARILKKPRGYVAVFLSRLPAVKKLERGKYYIHTARKYEIASHIISPSYLSLVTAFSIYNLTTQIPIIVYIVATRQHPQLKVEGSTIKFIKISKRRFFGYEYKNKMNIATIEKAIVDSLYLENDYGEAIEAFREAMFKHKLDINKFKEFCLMMKSPTLVSKAGFLLRLHGIKSSEMIPHGSKNYVRLSQGAKSRDKKWHVIYESQWLPGKDKKNMDD